MAVELDEKGLSGILLPSELLAFEHIHNPGNSGDAKQILLDNCDCTCHKFQVSRSKLGLVG